MRKPDDRGRAASGAADRARSGSMVRPRVVVGALIATVAVVLLSGVAVEDVPLPLGAGPTLLDGVGADCPAGEVALTFDDGPHPEHTSAILDILDEREVTATFFVLGEAVEREPDLAARIAADGHVLGNHTWDHPDLLEVDGDELDEQLAATTELITRVTDAEVEEFRPPFGNVDADVVERARAAGLQTRLWTDDLDLLDWEPRSPRSIVDGVSDGLVDGGVILAHDGVSSAVNTVAALPHIIEVVHDEGYCFATLDGRDDWVEDVQP
jgi:peptidoglycan-N-acetylglucosamine deacetylase